MSISGGSMGSPRWGIGGYADILQVFMRRLLYAWDAKQAKGDRRILSYLHA